MLPMVPATCSLVLLVLPLALLASCSPPVPAGDGAPPLDGGADADGGRDADRDGTPWPDGGDQDVHFPDAEVCTDVVDVVLVLDVSSSMRFVLDQLEEQIGVVVAAANELAPEAHFGLVGFVDSHRLDETGSEEGGLVHTTAETLQAAFRELRSVYTAHDRNPGDGPDGPTLQNPICEENALDSMYVAAVDFPWRDNATRVVIVVTDDTFLERPDNYGDRDGDGLTDRTDFPREGDYPALRTIEETVDALTERRIRVFAFTRFSPPGLLAPSRCGTPRRLPWSSVSDGWSTPYGDRAPIPESTDGRAFDVEQVRSGRLSLVATINEVVVDSYCDPPLI